MLRRSVESVQADLRVPSLFREAFRFVHSRSQKFLRNVHKLFTCTLVSSSPAGLRLETAFKIDKKKNEKKEFYFSSRTKMFLTRKEKHACRRENKKEFCRGFVRDRRQSLQRGDRSIHIAMGPTPDLTELARARNFPASRVALGCRSKCGLRTRRIRTGRRIAFLIVTGAQYAEFF